MSFRTKVRNPLRSGFAEIGGAILPFPAGLVIKGRKGENCFKKLKRFVTIRERRTERASCAVTTCACGARVAGDSRKEKNAFF